MQNSKFENNLEIKEIGNSHSDRTTRYNPARLI